MLGGYDGKHAQNANAAYLPSRDAWSQRAPLPAWCYGMGVTSIADFIYVVGGIGVANSALPPLQYSLQQNQWQIFQEPISKPWSYLGLVPLNTRLYSIGGRLRKLPIAQNLSYQANYTIYFPIGPQ